MWHYRVYKRRIRNVEVGILVFLFLEIEFFAWLIFKPNIRSKLVFFKIECGFPTLSAITNFFPQMEAAVWAGVVLGIRVDNSPSILIRTKFTPPIVGGSGGGMDIGAIRASS